MKFITEIVENIDLLTEMDGDKKSVYLVGPYISCEKANRNGRYYPMGIVEKEVDRVTREYIKEGRLLGEMNHPTRPAIDPAEASHKIVELRRQGTDFIGKAKVMESLPRGKILAGLISEGVKIGMSTRGLGSVKEDLDLKANVVCDDFRLQTVDAVLEPSGVGCFVAALHEGADWILDSVSGSWMMQETAHNMRQNLKTLSKREIKEKQERFFTLFLNELAKPRK